LEEEVKGDKLLVFILKIHSKLPESRPHNINNC